MGGGENLVDSPIDLKPGEAIYTFNYEIDTRGNYRRFQGYERVDGQAAPSEAAYKVLNFVAGVSAVVATDTVVGDASSATGIVVSITVSSGAFATNDAVGFLVIDEITGTFQDAEDLEVLGTPSATTNGVAGIAPTDALDLTYQRASIEARRTKIAAVPGSGNVRGAWQLRGVKYAFRDNVGGTACALYKSTTSGWALVDLGAGLAFTAGSVAPATGEVVTGGTSTAFGTVAQAVVTSGSWGAGTAAGIVYIHTIAGTFQAEAVTGGTAAVFTASGAQSATTIAPGGRYEFQNFNFYGDTAGRRMYGVSGVDKAFQFDGSGYVPISTGMVVDTPEHLRCHRKHLFLSFDGSMQHSLVGQPLRWSAVLGAGELGIGDKITGMHTIPGDVLAVMSRNSTHFLYGSSIQDWNLTEHSSESGAVEWTVQTISTLQYLDDRGVTSLQAVQAYGDFKSATSSENIQPIIDALNGTVIASLRVRDKDQYRLFYADGAYITGTFSKGKLVGWARGEFPDVVRCASSTEDTAGHEVLLFGSDAGFVYQMDKGTSFDGAEMEHVLRLAFNHFKSPARKKRFFEAIIEMTAPSPITINIVMDLNYAHQDILAPLSHGVEAFSGGAYWGSGVWEEFFWDSPVVAYSETYLEGTGANMGLTFQGAGIYDDPHTIQGVTIHYSPRGLNR